jgi:hypothetical protein
LNPVDEVLQKAMMVEFLRGSVLLEQKVGIDTPSESQAEAERFC